jgi:hypothetical protein
MSKLIRACVAIAAFAAFAVLPTSAMALNDGVVESPTGTVLTPTHTVPIPIKATSVGNLLMTDVNTNTLVTCQTATMEGELETNTGTSSFNVEGTVTKASFNNHDGLGCTGLGGRIHVNPSPATNGLPWCLRSTGTMKTHEFQVRGRGCTEEPRAIRFSLNVTALGLTCTYQRPAAIIGKYTTHPSDAVLSVSHVEFPRFESSVFCPAAGFLDMSFTLQRDTGGGVLDPVFIKNHDGK